MGFSLFLEWTLQWWLVSVCPQVIFDGCHVGYNFKILCMSSACLPIWIMPSLFVERVLGAPETGNCFLLGEFV